MWLYATTQLDQHCVSFASFPFLEEWCLIRQLAHLFVIFQNYLQIKSKLYFSDILPLSLAGCMRALPLYHIWISAHLIVDLDKGKVEIKCHLQLIRCTKDSFWIWLFKFKYFYAVRHTRLVNLWGPILCRTKGVKHLAVLWCEDYLLNMIF